METQFAKMNFGWNADPNAPMPVAVADGNEVWLRFLPDNNFNPPELAERHLYLRFLGCQRYRFTKINDHGWFLGQCRFSKIAPEWGDFYEVTGNFREAEDNTPWTTLSEPQPYARNYLFYFRDSTFECVTEACQLTTEAPAGLTFPERA